MKFLFLITLLLIIFPNLITENDCGTKISNLLNNNNEISIRLLSDTLILIFSDSNTYKYRIGNSKVEEMNLTISYKYSGTFIPFVKTDQRENIKYIVSYLNNQIIVYNDTSENKRINCSKLTAISPINDSDFLVSYKDNNQFKVTYFHLNSRSMDLINFSNLDINKKKIMNVYRLFDNYVYLSLNCSHIESGILSFDEQNKTFTIVNSSTNNLIDGRSENCMDLKEMQVIEMNNTSVIICLLFSELYCYTGIFSNNHISVLSSSNNNTVSRVAENKSFQLKSMCGKIQCESEHFSMYKNSVDELMIGCMINSEETGKTLKMEIIKPQSNCETQNDILNCRDFHVKDFIVYNNKQYYIGIQNISQNFFFFSNYIFETKILFYQKINDSKELNFSENNDISIIENSCNVDLSKVNIFTEENNPIITYKFFFEADYNKSCYFLYSKNDNPLNLYKIELISCHENCDFCNTSLSEEKMNCINCKNNKDYELIYYYGEEVGNCCNKITDCILYEKNCKCKLEIIRLRNSTYFIDKNHNNNNIIKINLISDSSLTTTQKIYIEKINGGTIKTKFESIENNGSFINDVDVDYINYDKGSFYFEFSLYENGIIISNTAKITIFVCDTSNEYFNNINQQCIKEKEEEEEKEEEKEKEEEGEEKEEKEKEEKEEEGEEDEDEEIKKDGKGKKDIEEEEEDKEGEKRKFIKVKKWKKN